MRGRIEVIAAYCDLLRLIATYRGFIAAYSAPAGAHRGSPCTRGPEFYCGLLRLIAAYCGLLRQVVREVSASRLDAVRAVAALLRRRADSLRALPR